MPNVSYHHATQGELLERVAAAHGDAEALAYPETGLRWSWIDLLERSRAFARGLLSLGVEPGERVAVWSDNRPDWVALQFAIGSIGAVLVTANTALQRREIGYLLRQSGTSAVFACAGFEGREYFETIVALRDALELPRLRHAVALEDEPEPGMLSLDELLRRGKAVGEDELNRRLAATALDAAANIQYTSGTTGLPKGVVLTHRNIVENGWATGDGLALTPADRLLLQVPLFHCFGCITSLLGAVTHATPIVLLRRFDPGKSLQALAGERCTVVNGVPTMFQAMLAHPHFSQLPPLSLRTGIMAGAVCPEPLMRRVIGELGCAGMLVAYGLTEASPAVTMSSPDDPIEVRCGTVGRALEGVELRIVDPITSEDCPRGASGELWVHGPNVMQGYFDNDAATALAITGDGWLRTGDLATRDTDGLVRIVGRIKEMINRGGENVYPAEVEDVLREHPDVSDVAVFGVTSETFGEEVAAAIVRADGSGLTEEKLLDWLAGRLAHFKHPSRVHFVDTFPLTGSGKVQKFRLAERFS